MEYEPDSWQEYEAGNRGQEDAARCRFPVSVACERSAGEVGHCPAKREDEVIELSKMSPELMVNGRKLHYGS